MASTPTSTAATTIVATAANTSTTTSPSTFTVRVTAFAKPDSGSLPFKLETEPALVVRRGDQPTLTVQIPTTHPVMIVFDSGTPFTQRASTASGSLDVIGPFCPDNVDFSPPATVVCSADPISIRAGADTVLGPQPTGPVVFERFTLTLRTDHLSAGHYEMHEQATWRIADNATAHEQGVELVVAFDASPATPNG